MPMPAMPESAPLSDAQKQAIRWQSRLSAKKCPEKTKQAFDDWLNASSEHAEAFQMIQYLWEQFGHLPSVAGAELNEARKVAKQTQANRRRSYAALVLFAVGIGLVTTRPDLAFKLTARHYQTAKGQTLSIALSEGSTIQLNTDSDIEAADIFGWRKAWLANGEAWFSIQHNQQQAFEVYAGPGRIWDIGTQFNVLTEADKTTVTVQEGEVGLASDNTEPLTLTAHQQISFDKLGHLSKMTEIKPEAIGSWRSGVLIFQNQRLTDVLQQLSRYHPAEFTVQDPSIENQLISGRFSTTDLKETLNTLSLGMGLNINQTQPGQFFIKKSAQR